MGTCAERLAQIACYGPDISTLAAHDTDPDLRRSEFKQLHLANLERFRLKANLLTFPGQIICTLPLHLYGGKDRRHLHYLPRESGNSILNHFPGYVIPGIFPVDSGLKVVARSRGSETDRGHILLISVLELLYPSCGTSGANDEHSGGKRVEGAGMPHLEFPYMKTPLYGSAYAFHRIERCPAQRLVDSYYLSAYEIHLLRLSINYESLPEKTDDSHHDTIEGKPYQLASFHEIDHPFAGATAYNE